MKTSFVPFIAETFSHDAALRVSLPFPRLTGHFAMLPAMRRVLLPIFGIALVGGLLAACGGGDSASGPILTSGSEPTVVEGAAGTTNVDADRFVFGAIPGKPVVYWIHTDW
jgi:hypothetical protein